MTNGQGAIGIGEGSLVDGDEAFAGQSSHDVEDARVVNTTRAELMGDHGSAAFGKGCIGGHGASAVVGGSCHRLVRGEAARIKIGDGVADGVFDGSVGHAEFLT